MGELLSRSPASQQARDHHTQALAIVRDISVPLSVPLFLEARLSHAQSAPATEHYSKAGLIPGTTSIVADVDEQTGVPIDETISEQVVVNLAAGSRTLSLIPVLSLDFHVTPSSMRYLAHKAQTSGELLILIEVIVPVALALIGVSLVATAVVRRRKPVPAAPAGTESADAPQPQST